MSNNEDQDNKNSICDEEQSTCSEDEEQNKNEIETHNETKIPVVEIPNQARMHGDPRKHAGLQLFIPEDVNPEFSNVAVVQHTADDFLLDFAHVLPGAQSGAIKHRVILTPRQIKKIFLLLKDNIQKYELQHGVITITNFNLMTFFQQGKKGGIGGQTN